MNKKSSADSYSLTVSTEENSVIYLFPCDYDSSEEDDYVNSSQNSIDSSELVDDSDNEAELISEFVVLKKKSDKSIEKSCEITTA